MSLIINGFLLTIGGVLALVVIALLLCVCVIMEDGFRS